MRKIRGPIFVLLEGIDGAGKSTVAAGLKERIEAEGARAVMLREPTTDKSGQEIRALLQSSAEPDNDTLTELFIADRKHDVEDNILPSLKEGRVVLLDRYYYSNAAYQAATIEEAMHIVRRNRSKGFPEPDVIYYIDITPQAALSRITKRHGVTRECYEKESLLEEVYARYKKVLPKETVFVDGTLSPEAVLNAIYEDLLTKVVDVQ